MNHEIKEGIKAGRNILEFYKNDKGSKETNNAGSTSVHSYQEKIKEDGLNSQKAHTWDDISGLKNDESISLLAYSLVIEDTALSSFLISNLTRENLDEQINHEHMITFLNILSQEIRVDNHQINVESVQLNIEIRIKLLEIQKQLKANNWTENLNCLNDLIKLVERQRSTYANCLSTEKYVDISSEYVDLERSRTIRDVIIDQTIRSIDLTTSWDQIKLQADDSKYNQFIASTRDSRVLMYEKISELNQVEFSCFSQFGEDGIIDYLMHLFEFKKPSFIEIGTSDYTESNTRFLYKRTLGTGILIDADKYLITKVKDLLREDYWRGSVHVLSRFINKDNILPILLSCVKRENLHVNLFSIDIDGNDYWILKTILPFIKADIMITEYNPFFGSKKEVTIPYDPNFNRFEKHSSGVCFGASIRAFYNLLSSFGYKLIGANLFNNNAFWIHQNNLKKYKLKTFDEDELGYLTDCRSREARDRYGRIGNIEGKNVFRVISNCEVYDINSNQIKELSKIEN